MTTMLRAAIMLAALVGLPAAWMYYGPLPPEAQRTVDRFIAATKEAVGWDQWTAARGESPEHGPGAAQAAAGVASEWLEAPSFAPNVPARPALAPLRQLHSGSAAPGGAARAPSTTATSTAATSTATTATAAGSIAARVEPWLAQLRSLGVAAYALEPWGGEQRMYRFHCEMPLLPGGQATEQFEAIAAEPEASVRQVASDVAAWHAARSLAMVR
ncbi:MAG TPA: hypothetical protein VEQ85_04025 [Lacipirellulaceae bacterium]|nr:hypothetical protein [Lacipirellulaceae bacterium]